MTKRCCALLLCVCLLFPVFAAVSYALPLDAGIDALRDEFVFGIGPETNGVVMDYYAFAPEGEGQFPLVVWLHGLVSGGYPGRQITKNDISYWASDEFQSRFAAGGAFILAPRSPESVSDWSDNMITPLKTLIDDYIRQNDGKIDAARIYIGGLSMGGKMTYKMVAAYPEMFAAAFPCSPYLSMSNSLAQGVKNTPLWQLSSKNDVYMNFNLWIRPDWEKVMAASECREDCRWTVFDTALKPDGSRPGTTHDTWYAATYDMFMYDHTPFTGSVTYDGNGSEITLHYPDGLIAWLNHYSSDYSVSVNGSDKGIFRGLYRIYTALVTLIAKIVKALGLKGVLG